MEKQYLIPESQLVALVRYLETKPYKEVAQGLAGLTHLRLFEENPNEQTPTQPAQEDQSED